MTNGNGSRAIHVWGAVIVTIVLAIAGWLDHKLEGHLKSTDTARDVGLANAREIDAEKLLNKAQTVWIDDLKKALEPIRDQQNDFKVLIHDVQRDVKEMKGPKR